VDTDSNRTEFLVKDLQPFTTYTFRQQLADINKLNRGLPGREIYMKF
jgi:hypothetical protein